MAINNIKMARNFYGRGKGEVKLRDYAHAARTFTSTPGYELAPKVGFTFHARIVYNDDSSPLAGNLTNTLSVLVKSAELPKFNIETEVLNKYNKKEVIQKKIIYEPLTLTLHDDTANTVRDFWLAYNQYYFVDSNLPQQAYELDDTYSPVRLATRYGLDSGRTGRFLKQIELYSMGNHTYTKYVLVNPMISSFDFDTHDYSEGNKSMSASIRLEFENVLYAEGATESIPGFGLSSFYYDNEFSPLKESNLTYPNLTRTIDQTENELFKRGRQIPLSNFDVSPAPKATTNNLQKIKIDAKSIGSLQGNKRFSFPTAASINNNIELREINADATLVRQGVINRSAAVSSNGVRVASPAVSTLGESNAQNTANVLFIQPTVPEGLTASERSFFLESYPALPSTDSRTKRAPYV